MDDKTVINLGLGKIAAGSVSEINPPRTPLEKHCATGYPVWRDTELQKRDWYFALEYAELTKEGPDLDKAHDGRKYRFPVPNDLLKPIRDKFTEWEQRGKYIWSSRQTLTLPYVRRVMASEFVPLFIDVLACRVATESTEFATQSNTKGETAEAKYDRAVAVAARANAFVIGPQDTDLADENSGWITARWGGEPNDG